MKSFSKYLKEIWHRTQSKASSTGSYATLTTSVYNTIITDRKQTHQHKQEKVT